MIRKLKWEGAHYHRLTDPNILFHSQDQEVHQVLQEHLVHKVTRGPEEKLVNLEPRVCPEPEDPLVLRDNLEKMVKMVEMVNQAQKDPRAPRVIQGPQVFQGYPVQKDTEVSPAHRVRRETLEDLGRGVTMDPLVQWVPPGVQVRVACQGSEDQRERTDQLVNEVQMGSLDP